jgi:hypothetical protein
LRYWSRDFCAQAFRSPTSFPEKALPP